MGNCIHTPQFPPLQKIKDFICCDDGEEDFSLALPIQKKAACGAYRGLKLAATQSVTSTPMLQVPRDPPFPAPPTDTINPAADSCKLRKATIVVSKEELELLLKNPNEFASQGIAVQFSDSFDFDKRYHRWRPALPTIAEVHNF